MEASEQALRKEVFLHACDICIATLGYPGGKSHLGQTSTPYFYGEE